MELVFLPLGVQLELAIYGGISYVKKGENIYKRKDGRWEARYIKGCSTEGKTVYGYCYGKTYREAKVKVTEAKAYLTQKTYIPGVGSRRCLASYCDEWLQLNRSKVKESTNVKYLSMLEKHVKPMWTLPKTGIPEQ